MDTSTYLQTSRSNEHYDENVDKGDIRSISNKAANAFKVGRSKDNTKYSKNNNIPVVRSNKILQALDLPTIINLNPRSVYNKINEFHTFVEEEEADITFMS